MLPETEKNLELKGTNFLKRYAIIWAALYPLAFLCEGSQVFKGSLMWLQLIKHASVAAFLPFALINIKQLANKHKTVFLLIFLSLFLYIFTIILSASIRVAELYSVLQIYLLLLAAFLIAELNEREQIYKVFFWTLVTVSCALILLHTSLGYHFFKVYIDDFGARTRLVMGFMHPGRVSIILLTVLIMSFYLFDLQNPSVWLFAILLICGIILTGARNALFAVSVAAIIYFCKRKLRFTIFLSVLSTTLLLLGMFLLIYAHKHNFNMETWSSGRIFLWGQWLKLNFEAPISNILLGSGQHLHIPVAIDKYAFAKRCSVDGVCEVDNSYLDLLYRQGLLGGLLIIVTLLAIIRKKNYANINTYHKALFIFIVMVFYSFFDDSLLSVGNLLAVAAIVLIVNYRGIGKEDT